MTTTFDVKFGHGYMYVALSDGRQIHSRHLRREGGTRIGVVRPGEPGRVWDRLWVSVSEQEVPVYWYESGSPIRLNREPIPEWLDTAIPHDSRTPHAIAPSPS